MRLMVTGCAILLALSWTGCAGDTAPVGTALTDKDIGVTLALAQQDKNGFPHAFRVTFENKSDHEGALALPVAVPSRADVVPPTPPVIGLTMATQDGRCAVFLYSAINARRFPPVEHVRLRAGESCVREYPAADFYEMGHSGPRKEAALDKCFGPGAAELRAQLAFRTGSAEDRPEEPLGVQSQPVVMHCSFGDKVAWEEVTEPSGTPLQEAVRHSDVKGVERLLGEGADPNAAATYVPPPLHLAAEKGDVGIAEMLLAKGARVDLQADYVGTPLHVAASVGNVEFMKLLIAKGAKVDAHIPLMGPTPLHRAALEGQLEAAKVLLAAGANPNVRNKRGDAPMHYAAMKGHAQLLALLLDKGGDVNATGDEGWTALHWAACEGYRKVVELLLARGADVSIRDNKGRTALAVAVASGRKETAQVLRQHGAKE